MNANYIFTQMVDFSSPWFLTKNGLFPLSQVKFVGTLLVTPTHVEHNFVKFENFNEIDNSKGELIEYTPDYVGRVTVVGYRHYKYQMEFGTLTKSVGEWIDDRYYYDINNNRTVIRVE